MWVAATDEPGEDNWVPDGDRVEMSLRVPTPGLLADLERRYNGASVGEYASLLVAAEDAEAETRGAAKKRPEQGFDNEPPLRLPPEVPTYQGYACASAGGPKSAVAGTVFSPRLGVFRLERESAPFRALDLRCAAVVATRWRESLISHCNGMPDRVRAVVSGHDRDGAPLQEPHLAFLPLAFAGHPHADGHLLGMAVALPHELPAEERRQLLRVLARVGQLRLGPLGVWHLERETSARTAWNLRAETWTAHPKGATQWSTVTPVVFDRHPKAKGRGDYQREVAQMIAAACRAVGLPSPREVVVTPVSAHLGVPPAHVFPRLTRKDGSERRHAHAILVFDQPVRGPVLIGAGRYRGYGVFAPFNLHRGP